MSDVRFEENHHVHGYVSLLVLVSASGQAGGWININGQLNLYNPEITKKSQFTVSVYSLGLLSSYNQGFRSVIQLNKT